MKAKILQENLAHGLTLVSKFVSARAQLPILSNIIIRTQKSKLVLLSTNLEISLTTSIGAKVDEEGEIAIPARTIVDLVSTFPKGQITLQTQGEQLSITSDNFESNLVGMNTSDFPQIPQDLPQNHILLPKDALTKALGQILFATSIDESRPILTGALFIFDKDRLKIVGTDGFRLSQKILSLPKAIDEKKFILPRVTLSEINRIADDGENIAISFQESESQVIFGMGANASQSILSSRTIEGEFPPFEKILPKEHQVVVRLDKQDFLRSVKSSIVIARDAAYVGKLTIAGDSVLISTESSTSGTQKTAIDAKIEGGEVEILYNLHFIEEFLNNTRGDEVVVELTDSTSPGVFRDATDPNYLHLIMPVKL